MSKLHTETTVPASTTRHKAAEDRQMIEIERTGYSVSLHNIKIIVSGEGLAPIVSAYSRLILVDGTVL